MLKKKYDFNLSFNGGTGHQKKGHFYKIENNGFILMILILCYEIKLNPFLHFYLHIIIF